MCKLATSHSTITLMQSNNLCLSNPIGQFSGWSLFITFTDQQGCKMSNFDQNTDHTEYNQTSLWTCNTGRHAAGIKNNK